MVKYNLAPVCLFVYKRPDVLSASLESLLDNILAAHTDVYVFSDAPKKYDDIAKVAEVRKIINNISGFQSVTVYEEVANKGLANSIIDGVTKIINKYDRVIVLEDDLVLAPNFLVYMNSALDFYQHSPAIFSISGYTVPIKFSAAQDVYFTNRASSWGWGTWKNRWNDMDWSIKDYDEFVANKGKHKSFNAMGSDLTSMLRKQMKGEINSWAIRWTYNQFKSGTYTVFPSVSKVQNEGFGSGATHTSANNKSRFYTPLDNSLQIEFDFPEQPFLDPDIIRQFTAPFSLSTRIIYKLKSFLNL